MTYAIAERADFASLSPQGAVGPGFMQAIRRDLALRRTVRELDCLDDRQLADIGLTRADIPAAARRALGQPAQSRSFLAEIAEQIFRARARASMIRDLRRLPDHILSDIGIERSMIVEAVDGVLACHDQAAPPPAARPAAPSPVHDLLRRLDAAVRPLRHWNMSRIAAGQLARFDGKTMADLGYVKGDVDWVPDVMAERRLKPAANRNQARMGVA